MNDYINKSSEYLEAVRDKFYGNIYDAGDTYKDLLKLVLDVPPERSGRVYDNIEGKSSHTAAADQEAPAPLSRQLIDSIELEQGPQSDNSSEVYIKSDLKYVLALEFGSSKNMLGPKPAWNKTLITFRNELGDIALDGFYRR